MEKQYYVCIDFGHGETTASYIDLTASYEVNKEGTYDVPKLNILNGSNDEARKVETVICQGEDDKWRFATADEDFSRPGLSMQFKAKVEDMSAEDKEHYKAFINLVFKAIIARNNTLKFDENNPNNRNFELCIACPSAWGTDNRDGHNTVIEDYKNFFSQSLPIPVKFVIRESDAAFFKFIHLKNQNIKNILVIDLGSSTIDFTYYPRENSENYPKGAANGASHVERAIQKWCADTQNEYKNAKEKIPSLQKLDNDKSVNWEMGLLHYIKMQKEDYYTRNRQRLDLNLPASYVMGDELAEKLINAEHCGDLLYHCKIQKDLLFEILADYRSDLKDDLIRLHDSGAAPEMIILTGGASRMPRVEELVEDVFQEVKVFCDPNPSYVVSDGIAMYAYADHKFRKGLIDMENTIKSELTEEILISEITDAFNEALQEVQLPPILSICDDFVAGKFTTLQTLLNKVEEHNNTIVGANATRLKDYVSDAVHEKISTIVSDKIDKIFKESFHTTASVPFNLDWSGVDFSVITINNDSDIQEIHNIGNGLFCQGIFSGSLNWEKDRDPSERELFDNYFREFQNSALFELPATIKTSSLETCNRSIQATLSAVKEKGLFCIY